MEGIFEPHWQIGLTPLPIGKRPMGKTENGLNSQVRLFKVEICISFRMLSPFMVEGGRSRADSAMVMVQGMSGESAQ